MKEEELPESAFSSFSSAFGLYNDVYFLNRYNKFVPTTNRQYTIFRSKIQNVFILPLIQFGMLEWS